MLNSISTLGETRPEQEWSNGTEFSSYSNFPEKRVHSGAFHSTKNTEISGPKLNGTIKIPGKVFENLGIRFECTLFSGKSE